MRVLVEEKPIVRLLKTIGNDTYHTRELLDTLKGWSYGHRLLLRAEKLGLIERKRSRPEGRGNWRVYNRLTGKGREVLKIARRLGVQTRR